MISRVDGKEPELLVGMNSTGPGILGVLLFMVG
jgi:hypothetical protein